MAALCERASKTNMTQPKAMQENSTRFHSRCFYPKKDASFADHSFVTPPGQDWGDGGAVRLRKTITGITEYKGVPLRWLAPSPCWMVYDFYRNPQPQCQRFNRRATLLAKPEKNLATKVKCLANTESESQPCGVYGIDFRVFPDEKWWQPNCSCHGRLRNPKSDRSLQQSGRSRLLQRGY